MKLHAQLENALKIRINSNDDIIPAIKKLMEMGKLDKPKEIAMFAIILDRLGKMEDEALKDLGSATYTHGAEVNKTLEGLDPLPEDGTNVDVTGEDEVTDTAKPDENLLQ